MPDLYSPLSMLGGGKRPNPCLMPWGHAHFNFCPKPSRSFGHQQQTGVSAGLRHWLMEHGNEFGRFKNGACSWNMFQLLVNYHEICLHIYMYILLIFWYTYKHTYVYTHLYMHYVITSTDAGVCLSTLKVSLGPAFWTYLSLDIGPNHRNGQGDDDSDLQCRGS